MLLLLLFFISALTLTMRVGLCFFSLALFFFYHFICLLLLLVGTLVVAFRFFASNQKNYVPHICACAQHKRPASLLILFECYCRRLGILLNLTIYTRSKSREIKTAHTYFIINNKAWFGKATPHHAIYNMNAASVSSIVYNNIFLHIPRIVVCVWYKYFVFCFGSIFSLLVIQR